VFTGGRLARGERAGALQNVAGRTEEVARGVRMPKLPDPSEDVVLRPHSVWALGVELAAAVIGLLLAVDAIRRGSVGTALACLAWTLVLGGGGLLAYRRSTRLDASGVTIRRVLTSRRLSWPAVQGFELLPHRRGRKDRIVVVTDDGPVAMPHGDSKSLVLRPEMSRQWYLAVIDRLEAVRVRYA
jgi:hypothetical protein